MKICIDAGHGGKDPGACSGSRHEANDTLRMATALRSEMQKRGWQASMTRTGDTYPSLTDRSNQANREGADVFVSLHRNSAGADANGAETLYRTTSKKTAANNAKSKALAENVNRRMVAATGFRDRGAKVQNTNTAVLNNTLMPAVTVEAGFVSNAGDNATFDRKFDALISAIADGIVETFGGSAAASSSSGTGSAAAKPQTPVSVPATMPYVFTPTCKKGESSARVKWVQTRLGKHGVTLTVDGIFGSNTEAGVKKFQQARKNEGRDIGAVDGIVGPKTAAILAE